MSKLRVEYPNVAAVHAQDSRLALLKNDVTGARKAIDRAEKLEPRSIETLSVSIALDLKQNNATGARTRLEERLKEEQSPQLLLLAANTYIGAEQSDGGRRVATGGDSRRPFTERAIARHARVPLLNQKKLDEAFHEFEALSTRQARPVQPLTMMGMILEQQGKPELAKKRYEEVLALDSRAGTALNNLAWLMAESGEDLDEAFRLAQSAVAVAPGDATNHRYSWLGLLQERALQERH